MGPGHVTAKLNVHIGNTVEDAILITQIRVKYYPHLVEAELVEGFVQHLAEVVADYVASSPESGKVTLLH